MKPRRCRGNYARSQSFRQRQAPPQTAAQTRWGVAIGGYEILPFGDGSIRAEWSGEDFYFSVEDGFLSRFRRPDAITDDGPRGTPSDVVSALVVMAGRPSVGAPADAGSTYWVRG